MLTFLTGKEENLTQKEHSNLETIEQTEAERGDHVTSECINM